MVPATLLISPLFLSQLLGTKITIAACKEIVSIFGLIPTKSSLSSIVYNTTMASSGRKVTLVSFDGIKFVMEEAVAVQSLVIKDMIESGWASNPRYPPSLVTARALEKVVEHMKKHAGEDPESEATKKFDSEFADGLEDNQEVLFGVLQVAYDLRIDGLFHLLCDKVASMLQGKTVEQIRELFHIKNDFTPQEEEEAQREFARIFE